MERSAVDGTPRAAHGRGMFTGNGGRGDGKEHTGGRQKTVTRKAPGHRQVQGKLAPNLTGHRATHTLVKIWPSKRNRECTISISWAGETFSTFA